MHSSRSTRSVRVTVRSVHRRVVGWSLTAVAWLLWFCGCAGARQASTVSPLSGTWQAEDDCADTLVIQRDGTFDFTRTMWAMAGDVSTLRRAGDRLERPEDGVQLEIVASEFTPRTSYIRLKATHRLPEGAVETSCAEYRACLGAGGGLAVRAGVLPCGDACSQALPVRLYRRVGDAPAAREPPPLLAPTKDEWIALGRRQFAGENWFERLRAERLSSGVLDSVLLMPRDDERAKRFLVVRVKAVGKTFYESDLASSGADAAMVGCSVLHIEIPELEAYGRPARARVADLAAQVRSATQEAVALLHPVRCGLETYDNGTYIGHYLWQKDNAPYDGWICWDAAWRFDWYGASADASRGKPALFEQLGQYEGVVAEYRAHGFENTRLTKMQENVPNPGQQSIRLLAAAVGVGDLR